LTEVKNAKQVSDVVWEIPPTYKQGMNVPARIYATKKLLEEMDNGVIEQVTNVAMLPGIEKYAYAMADAHWGYGFPIGGVAAFDTEKGVISPGGIGFDINCLHPDSKVIDEDGVWRTIADAKPASQGFLTFDKATHAVIPTRAIMKQQRPESDSILKIKTRGGKAILVTPDHPVLSRRGMVPAGNLGVEDHVLTSGLSGIPFSEPYAIEIVSSDSLNAAMERMGISDRGSSRAQIMAQLRARHLDRLLLNDPRMPAILKLLGFVFGDGCIPEGEIGHFTSFWGKPHDLARIQSDLKGLGFASHGFSRGRHHRIETAYGPSEFDHIEHSLQASSTALSVLPPMGRRRRTSTVCPNGSSPRRTGRRSSSLLRSLGLNCQSRSPLTAMTSRCLPSASAS
jgi:tRNA-splicing ligase RtcB